jgi:hypothetical protein
VCGFTTPPHAAHAGTSTLDDRLRRQTRPLVEIVDVLRDAAVEPPEPVQLGQGEVGGIRRRRPDEGVRDASQRPVPASTLVTADEIPVGELAGIEAAPHAAGAAEVRDAGLGADAGAREGDGAPRLGEKRRQAIDVAHRVRGQARGCRGRVRDVGSPDVAKVSPSVEAPQEG